ncbi:MAG TPA: SMP-30/gluconolactonase/LRE family protein, partial [Solirubrobacteraceae bacterium]
TVDPDGRVVVGVLRFRPFAGEAPVPGEFVRIDADGSITTVLPGVDWANGCAYSPDGRTFYGCDYQRGVVLAAERRDDGTYGPPRTVVVSPSGEADGLAVDEHGALWVALGSAGRVGRFRPDGTLEDELEVPGGFVASLCFGGADGRDLFVTTAGSDEDPTAGAVFLTRAPVAGALIPPAR